MAELHCRHLKADIDRYSADVAEKVADKSDIVKEMAGKWSIKPSLAGKLVDILMAGKREVSTAEIISRFGLTATTAKRYLRQLTEFGYLEALGGNKNRTHVLKTTETD